MSGDIKTAPNTEDNCECVASSTTASTWEGVCRKSFGPEYDYAGDWEWADCPTFCMGDSALWTNHNKGVPKCKHVRYSELTNTEKIRCCLSGVTGTSQKTCDPKFLDKFNGECPSIVGSYCTSPTNFITTQCQTFCNSRINNGKAECDMGVENYCKANPENVNCKCFNLGGSETLKKIREETGIKGDYTCWYDMCDSGKHPIMTSSMKKIKDNCTMVNCVIKDVNIQAQNVGKIDMSQDCKAGRGDGGKDTSKQSGDQSGDQSDANDKNNTDSGFKMPQVITNSSVVYHKILSGDFKGALSTNKTILYAAAGIAFSTCIIVCAVLLCLKRVFFPPRPHTLLP